MLTFVCENLTLPLQFHYSLHDLLLSLSLICPDLFPRSAIDDAAEILKRSMDTNVIRTWDRRVPSFQTPPPLTSCSSQVLLCPSEPPTPLHCGSLESCPATSGSPNNPTDEVDAIILAEASAIVVAPLVQDSTHQSPPPGRWRRRRGGGPTQTQFRQSARHLGTRG